VFSSLIHRREILLMDGMVTQRKMRWFIWRLSRIGVVILHPQPQSWRIWSLYTLYHRLLAWMNLRQTSQWRVVNNGGLYLRVRGYGKWDFLKAWEWWQIRSLYTFCMNAHCVGTAF